MTPEEYKQLGYDVSSLVSQSALQRAEAEVLVAYLIPICGEEGAHTESARQVSANLVYLLLLQRSIAVTRAGAKIKATQTSTNANAEWAIAQECASCHCRLEALRKQFGGECAEVQDICKIYFKSNFISF